MEAERDQNILNAEQEPCSDNELEQKCEIAHGDDSVSEEGLGKKSYGKVYFIKHDILQMTIRKNRVRTIQTICFFLKPNYQELGV